MSQVAETAEEVTAVVVAVVLTTVTIMVAVAEGEQAGQNPE